MVYAIKDKEDLQAQLEAAGDLLVVVDFHATWCGPCKFIAPKLEEFATSYASKIVVVKVDVDDCEELAVLYNVSSMPTFVFIKNKEEVGKLSGANATKLEELIKHFDELPKKASATNSNEANKSDVTILSAKDEEKQRNDSVRHSM